MNIISRHSKSDLANFELECLPSNIHFLQFKKSLVKAQDLNAGIRMHTKEKPQKISNIRPIFTILPFYQTNTQIEWVIMNTVESTNLDESIKCTLR